MHKDVDPIETQEWLDALDSVLESEGEDRAHYLLTRLARRATRTGTQIPYAINTPYRNTIPSSKEARMPGDLFMERRIRSIVRWNALAMVMRANKHDPDLGGHISSFSSGATLYDIGFNYFFKGPSDGQEGDLIYFQGHSSPGIYSRAFLEGRLSEDQLDNFRREVDGEGLPSYPHPKLKPDFWQFPTVSMGLGPLQAIYQAHFMKYLDNRDFSPVNQRKVWAFLGDGEMDEPESLGAIGLAGREKLDNLIFVVNCNLQRLDGPVRGNGKIMQELEGQFRGAGWNVIKVVWGRHWDPLFAQDKQGIMQQRMDECVDGDYQNCKAKGGAFTREHFFGKYPELKEMVAHLSDDDIYNLNRGGHDPYKVYAAYHAAVNHSGQPTVILAKTVKGYAYGESAEAANTAHSVKKLSLKDLKAFRDRFDIPVKDADLPDVPYYRPDADSPEMVYMRKRRESLGGFVPQRRITSDSLPIPDLKAFEAVTKGSGEREISSTMAYVRVLSALVKDKKIGKHLVPIVPDEARTFGMEGMFRQLGIYSSEGQLYEPMDSDQVMFYKEDKKGQILEEGINEAGAHAAWIAAGTSYSCNNVPMIPFYTFYSMFGFQRTGDLAWASGDIQARGFLIGATAGRTTLNGEGLQHQDGHSHIMASTIPNCISYDPTYGYEIAVIVQDGLRRMMQEQENVFYYLTTMNETYQHPALPEGDGVVEGIIKGLYCFEENSRKSKLKVQLMGCGTIFNEVREAAAILRNEFKVESDIWSATSFNELRRDGMDVERWNLMHPTEETRECYVTQCLKNRQGPVIAATDYMKVYADQIRDFIPATFISLGTDGFGRSDTRKKLRQFFEVDRYYIVIAALYALKQDGLVKGELVARAMKKYNIDPNKPNPMYS
ncbi:pyruvate dehydrogenase (acetyl-transferring), homodimeric type [Aestuariirhabdus sp. Z084]|uniref:pyruvate dehydrogenase (acetyl-transferring), homodimeric type n=1 Tax=Aestuariirhabdus haliotis TaxID=2918751 RepID=UPI00201B3FCA|nr:pyruvate dehydrogenase (acetyl-transferring), homodimeric type [Aestuariirhabdus haliotis]MCL6415585.1 pyruvate dehydrogenase (acetyl-transferring), homodimeric type [Aestuariirhabdus haliotis]MCL6419580.1 pyruvate dehydrogenase (acetyl-transferring), homodimeric type [Aestuariirhabdus haliotis]